MTAAEQQAEPWFRNQHLPPIAPPAPSLKPEEAQAQHHAPAAAFRSASVAASWPVELFIDNLMADWTCQNADIVG